MQVVQPKPTRLNPRASRSSCSPDSARYSDTTCEPGASEVFTQGFDCSPFARALRARRPAAISTEGFEVLVHDVIAAIVTAPCLTPKSKPLTFTLFSISPGFLNSPSSAARNPAFACERSTRSCGRLGPASEGSTVARSSSRRSL
jgi:hypothetical protein